MSKNESEATKQDVLKKIEVMLRRDINLDAKVLFSKIEGFLEPRDKMKGFISGDIGYVHIDEKRQAEYLAWEENIKQEWLVTIENIRESIKREPRNPLAK